MTVGGMAKKYVHVVNIFLFPDGVFIRFSLYSGLLVAVTDDCEWSIRLTREALRSEFITTRLTNLRL